MGAIRRPGDTVKNTVLDYHGNHPGDPVKIFYMPPGLSELFRAVGTYDPRFGDACYAGSFDEGFNHAEVLTDRRPRRTGPCQAALRRGRDLAGGNE